MNFAHPAFHRNGKINKSMVRSFCRSFARQPDYRLADTSASTLAFQTTSGMQELPSGG